MCVWWGERRREETMIERGAQGINGSKREERGRGDGGRKTGNIRPTRRETCRQTGSKTDQAG